MLHDSAFPINISCIYTPLNTHGNPTIHSLSLHVWMRHSQLPSCLSGHIPPQESTSTVSRDDTSSSSSPLRLRSHRIGGGPGVQIEEEANRMWAGLVSVRRIRNPLPARQVGDDRHLHVGLWAEQAMLNWQDLRAMTNY
jgi:hypothetical protein